MASEAAQDLDRSRVEVLILELERGASRIARNRGAGAGECAAQVLIEARVAELSCERQILHRIPGGARADLGNPECETAGRIGRAGAQPTAIGRGEQKRIAGRTIGDVAVRSEHRRTPCRVPVVLVEGADIPGVALLNAGAVGIDTIEDVAEGQTTVADFCQAAGTRRIPGPAEGVLGGAVGEGRFNLQAVAHAGRQVLQLESAGDGIAPGRFGMTGRAVGGRVVGAVHFVRGGGDMQRTPGLIEAQVADDIRNMVAGLRIALEGVGGGAVTGGRRSERAEQRAGAAERSVHHTRRTVGLGVFERDRRRNAAAEFRRVRELRDTGRVERAREEAGRTDPRTRQRPLRIELRNRLTEGEACELDEQEVVLDKTARDILAALQIVEQDARVGADDTVFGLRAGIDEQVQAFAIGEEIAVVGVRTAGAALIERHAVRGTVERGSDTDRAADADAGIGARNIIEARAVKRAHLHILDRLRLDGKISRVRTGQRDETRRGAEHSALNDFHVKPPSWVEAWTAATRVRRQASKPMNESAASQLPFFTSALPRDRTT